MWDSEHWDKLMGTVSVYMYVFTCASKQANIGVHRTWIIVRCVCFTHPCNVRLIRKSKGDMLKEWGNWFGSLPPTWPNAQMSWEQRFCLVAFWGRQQTHSVWELQPPSTSPKFRWWGRGRSLKSDGGKGPMFLFCIRRGILMVTTETTHVWYCLRQLCIRLLVSLHGKEEGPPMTSICRGFESSAARKPLRYETFLHSP